MSDIMVRARKMFRFSELDVFSGFETKFFKTIASHPAREYLIEKIEAIKEIGGISAIIFEVEGEIAMLMMSSYTEEHLEYFSKRKHIENTAIVNGCGFSEIMTGHLIDVLSSFASRVSEEVYAEKQRRKARRHQKMLLARHSRIGDTRFRDNRAGM